jgi:hypothetical protein
MQIYWINRNEIKLILDDKTEILTPDQLIIKYGENEKIMSQIRDLLKNPKDDFLCIYDKILTESAYDEKYATREKISDGKMRLDAYEIMIRNIMRTKKDKKGICQTYAMRLQDELDNLNIENYLLVSQENDYYHYANLMIVKNKMLVADIAQDLIEKEIIKDQDEEIIIRPKKYAIPLNNYLENNEVTYVQERIKDNGKKLSDLYLQPIKSFVINYTLKHDDFNLN